MVAGSFRCERCRQPYRSSARGCGCRRYECSRHTRPGFRRMVIWASCGRVAAEKFMERSLFNEAVRNGFEGSVYVWSSVFDEEAEEYTVRVYVELTCEAVRTTEKVT